MADSSILSLAAASPGVEDITLETARLILEYIKVLIWPLVVICLVIFLKPQLIKILEILQQKIDETEKLKYKDLELVFQKLEEVVDERVEKLEGSFISAIEQVRMQEASLSPEYRRMRDKTFQTLAEHLKTLPVAEQLAIQEQSTRNYLQKLTITLPQIKDKLKKLNYYDGDIDDNFTAEFTKAIEAFQHNYAINPVDGIFGNLTYAKLVDVLKEPSA